MSTPVSAPARSFSPDAIHMVRTLQNIGITLSQMADQKASILMGATFVVFSISIGQASRPGGLTLSIGVLSVFALIAAIFAVLTILPSATPKAGMPVNPLFFGSFTAMSEEAFTTTVLDGLCTPEAAYRMMLHDIYQNGQVLARKKYRMLGIAYRVFLFGLMLTVLALLIEKLPSMSG